MTVGRPGIRPLVARDEVPERRAAAAQSPNAPSTWTHAPARAASSTIALEIVERAGVHLARLGADDRRTSTASSAAASARRHPALARRPGRPPAELRRSRGAGARGRSSRGACRRRRRGAAAPRRGRAARGPSRRAVDAMPRRREAGDVRHLAAGHEARTTSRAGRPSSSSTQRPATASSADVAGVGSARPVFWSQAETSQSAASAAARRRRSRSRRTAREPIAMTPGSPDARQLLDHLGRVGRTVGHGAVEEPRASRGSRARAGSAACRASRGSPRRAPPSARAALSPSPGRVYAPRLGSQGKRRERRQHEDREPDPGRARGGSRTGSSSRACRASRAARSRRPARS